ncbi:hypothetical protein KUU59_09580 [Pseudomonas aeruginosa]|uniref:hypothetical protein n=1 Tax=Pseudomonas aeruginosa TaxID=287 RepID=UPI000E316BBE|nr:hypothetical protein [Pseudomonas aeruginosa]MBV6005222.1 hypothetical protein [Pseudomonas aeruginosa]MBV6018468.1 hypothetical protein [Pseudomonas aeruginosa]MBV6030889.1 hypothetical protein [Pseudomonas aeruginosa]MBV6038438.1 hypothetical protein [Pseudomonas aeruginosa]MBV6043077.1 hypothetical protein [Pseudomonas aeruginosa]
MSKFKAGDMAMIVGCMANPEDIGKVVELYQYVLRNEAFIVSGHYALSGDEGWIVTADNVIDTTGVQGFVLVNERHLMPLKGDFHPEQQKAKEEIV